MFITQKNNEWIKIILNENTEKKMQENCKSCFSYESQNPWMFGDKAKKKIQSQESRNESSAADEAFSQINGGRRGELERPTWLTHLIVVVHAGEVDPAFVTSDLNETLDRRENTQTCCSLQNTESAKYCCCK